MAEVQLTRGLVAHIDDADLPLVSGRKWQASKRRDGKGYYVVAKGGIRMHRLLMGVTDGRIVDHRDGDGLNNRRINLRVGTQSQNCVNRKTTPGRHPRGVKLQDGRWRASIKYRGKSTHLGYFDSAEEAHAAYLSAARDLHGDWLPQAGSMPDGPNG